MESKTVLSISEIIITKSGCAEYSYGFTVAFSDGEIHNYIRYSTSDSDQRIIDELKNLQVKLIQEQRSKP